MNIRIATKNDAKAILDIYSYYILNTTYTFEYTVPTTEEFAKRISTDNFPYLVYELDGKIVGYAYAAKHHERAAYQYNATLSVYVDNNYLGKRIGSKLYNAMFKLLSLQNYINLYAIITGLNTGSIKMHEKSGFETFAVYKNSGHKFEKWIDVVWMTKVLGEYQVPPKSIIRFCDLPKDDITNILTGEL